MSKLSDYAKELVEADALVKDLTDKLDEAKKVRDEITDKMLTEMQEQDLTEVSVDGLGKKFIMRKDIYANYLVDNKADVFDALRQLGQGDIIKEDINSKTFNSTIRVLIEENGGALPDILSPYVSLFEKSKIGIVKRS